MRKIIERVPYVLGFSLSFYILIKSITNDKLSPGPYFLFIVLAWIILIINYFSFCHYLVWDSNTKKTRPKITFKQFIFIYNIEPTKFCFESKTDFSTKFLCQHFLCYKNKTIDFKSYFDYYRFKMFIKHRKKYKENLEHLKNQKWLIENLQKDLNKQQEEIIKFVETHI